ncbi:MAG TPA: xanthine dehydrogenase family protein molybdopterin-binding subunit [Stellaceae bacterium]|nr:xanthine dehydrogenase family protein molybdopterin-binding subunit [Stellaceae bacterium]
MTDPAMPQDSASAGHYGIGAAVPRTEDEVLLRGLGRYTDDIDLPGQAFAAMVRSPFGHARILGIDSAAALAVPGVLAVYDGRDLIDAGLGGVVPMAGVPNYDGTPMHAPTRLPLPIDRARFVGEVLAFVVAETDTAAREAAELVALDLDPLPAAATADAALAPGAVLVHDTVAGNVAVDYRWGDADAVAEAFATAAHAVRLELESNRVVANPLEPRAALGDYDPASGRWTLHTPSQGVFSIRSVLAREVLKVPVERLRVLTDKVGGSFGMKIAVFPEQAMVLFAARALKRPVKWRDDRSGAFLADHHGRDSAMTAELALDAEGRFLAVRLTGWGNLGAWPVAALPFTVNAVKNVVGVYGTPLLHVATRGVYTNTVPVGAYRGAGRPEGNYYMERLIDAAAMATGIDRLALRRLNHIPPDAVPYAAPSGMRYDSGDYPAVFGDALRLGDCAGFPERRRESTARGRLRGLGIASFLEVTAPSVKEMGGIRFERDGTVTITTGTLDYGQGHGTTFAQVVVERLGIPFDCVRLVQGDSDQLVAGGGSGGSRSIMGSGTAFFRAADEVIEHGRRLAAHYLEAAVADIEFGRGRFTIVGTDRSIGIMDLVRQIRDDAALPEDLPRALDATLVTDSPPSAFPNGAHVAEVEIDPETGETQVVRYAMVNDFGTVVNPLIVQGQSHGGVVQGIGQALMERTIYDSHGQLVTGSFLDYALPRAADVPSFAYAERPVPATTNPLGVKGCGEAGCTGALPAVMSAVLDALAPLGIRHIDMPVTPEKVWRAIRDAASST